MNPITTEEKIRNYKNKEEYEYDYYVFEEERNSVKLRKIVIEAVAIQYTHPQGPATVYGLLSHSEELVIDKIDHYDALPENIPRDVKDKFINNLVSEVRKYTEKLYKEMKKEIDPENEDFILSELYEKFDENAESIGIPEEY